MGQLERYGLYVLCLVIFLILGVAIWGGDDANAGAGGEGNALVEGDGRVLSTGDQKVKDIQDLLRKQNGSELQKQDAAEKHASVNFKPADPQPNTNELAGGRGGTLADPDPKPVMARTHTILKDDTLAGISQRFFGTTTRWKEILALNPGVSERKLVPGKVLILPADGAAPARQPVAVGGSDVHKVRKGDSPWSIAEKHYGAARATEYAKRIMKLNKIAAASSLQPGTVLKLPPR